MVALDTLASLCTSTMIVYAFNHFAIKAATGLDSLKNPIIFWMLLQHSVIWACLGTLIFGVLGGVIDSHLESR